MSEEDLIKLVEDTEAVAQRWRNLFESSGDRATGAAAAVLLALAGALRSGPLAADHLEALCNATGRVAEQNLRQLQTEPS